ncbi:unnamed protein product [Clonostachys chloroleuca]|uniref:N-acetylgalactosaminide beta-1,3-galactosyltransferase n=1 Tax=Clonostachys chloroleuca TaxID=1926264 RepID=A0AA35M2Y9_9HYPO|nr:unnamed protein product [Clonostachys chloroleuca]
MFGAPGMDTAQPIPKTISGWVLVPIIRKRRLFRLFFLVFFTLILLVWGSWHGDWVKEFSKLPIPIFGKPEYYTIRDHSLFEPFQVENPNIKSVKELCQTFPRHILDTIQPVLKIGHGEDRTRVEAQLFSASACFSDHELLVFSDLTEEIRGYHVIDVLEDLPDLVRKDNVELDMYDLQKKMYINGTLDKHDNQQKIDGWMLDKYKFLPMIEKAWNLKPNKEFYVFYESDTYVLWDNMFRFLKNFDADDRIYMGSPSPGREHKNRWGKLEPSWFANGGPGFVLSRGAIKALLHPTYLDGLSLTEKWATVTREDSCGDSILGLALLEAGIEVMGLWPMFNPHALGDIPFGDQYWCQPALTLHRTSPEDMRRLWRWEFGHRRLEQPMLYADLWELRNQDSGVTQSRGDGEWELPTSVEAGSLEACRSLCLSQEGCQEWLWKGDEHKCVAIRSPGDGHEAADGYRAELGGGWVRETVQEFRQCNVTQWVRPSTSRIF